MDGHTEAVWVTMKDNPTPEEVRKAMLDFNPNLGDLPTSPKKAIIVKDEPDRPQPRLDRGRGNGMSVSVGRIRSGIRFICMGHNTGAGRCRCEHSQCRAVGEERLAVMLIVAWETTAACNLSCRYCRACATPSPEPDELSLDEALAFLDSIAPLQPMLILSGVSPCCGLIFPDHPACRIFASPRLFGQQWNPDFLPDCR